MPEEHDEIMDAIAEGDPLLQQALKNSKEQDEEFATLQKRPPGPLTVEEMKVIIPDDDIKEAFMRRDDIVLLPPEEREKQWEEHLIHVNHFRELLSKLPVHFIV